VALPTDAGGQRLRASVPDIIMLQAVWFALQHLGELPPAERALGLDRAGVLIEKHSAALRRRWRTLGRSGPARTRSAKGDRMPKALVDLITDTRAALKRGGLQASGSRFDQTPEAHGH
jgi:hypothetical protein